jgi:hypothetical protein
MQRRLLPDSCYKRLAESGRVSPRYNASRYSLFPADLDGAAAAPGDRAFWTALFAAYCDAEFISLWLRVFEAAIRQRVESGAIPDEYKAQPLTANGEIFLMRDLVNYQLLPHTDAPIKMVSALFYLPADDSNAGLGTSLYVPKHLGLTHPGGGQMPRADFDLAETVPFLPNTLVAFPKTAACFHGVEPVNRPDQRRDILLFDIKFGGGRKS